MYAVFALAAGARAAVLDQIRYLALSGDPSESVKLAREAVEAWQGGRPDENLYMARRRLGEALNFVGRYRESLEVAEPLSRDIREDPDFGPRHELSIGVAVQLARLHRTFGRYQEAHELEEFRLSTMDSSPPTR